MIVKVQRSLPEPHGSDRTLIYDQTNSFAWEGETTQAVADALGSRVKAFFFATVADGGKRLELGEEAPWQSW